MEVKASACGHNALGVTGRSEEEEREEEAAVCPKGVWSSRNRTCGKNLYINEKLMGFSGYVQNIREREEKVKGLAQQIQGRSTTWQDNKMTKNKNDNS